MTSVDIVNQLVVVVVSGRQSEELMHELTKNHFYFTRIDSTGMVFQEPTVFLLIGLNNSRLGPLMSLIERICQPRQEYVPVQFNPPAGFPPMSMIEARIGGALVYQVDIERFEQF